MHEHFASCFELREKEIAREMGRNERVLTISAVQCTNVLKIIGRKASPLPYRVDGHSRLDGHDGRLVVIGEREGIVVHN